MTERWHPGRQCRWMTHASSSKSFRYACQLEPGHDGEHEAHFGKVTSTYWEPPDDGVEDPAYERAAARGAFYCLGLVGLAVAYGMLYTCAAAQVQFTKNAYGRVDITTSVDSFYLQLAMRGCLP